MNERLNIQDLIDLLAAKYGMGKKDADSFVKEFFLLIEESLEKDKYVKIKGLGTFKLIDVESRESVNVNTGERFEIQSHTKVSFTPEPTLKDIINKPFSHFETVVLNDNTVLEDTPLENENEDEDDIDAKISEVKEQAVEVGNEQPIAIKLEEIESPEDIDETAEDSVISAGEEIAENIEEASENSFDTVIEETPAVFEEREVGTETLSDVPANEFVSVSEPPESVKREPVDSSTMKYFIGIVIFVVVLCGGAIVFMYYPDLFDTFTSKPVHEEIVESKTDETVDKTALADSIVKKDVAEPIRTDTVTESLAVASKPQDAPKEKEVRPAPKKEQKKTAVPFEPDSVGYKIVGTETTYTIKEGETLTRVALRFYGTKALWPYIVKHNPGVIKNPDNVPFGTTIKIPKLVKKQ